MRSLHFCGVENLENAPMEESWRMCTNPQPPKHRWSKNTQSSDHCPFLLEKLEDHGD